MAKIKTRIHHQQLKTGRGTTGTALQNYEKHGIRQNFFQISDKYITQATKQIAGRHEHITPSKIVAELTLGFWVSLLNSEYERILWKDLRRAFPFMPKSQRQRKNVSAPLNSLRVFRNRVFHNESICWNINKVKDIHQDIITVIGWMNKDVPEWLKLTDRFDEVCNEICKTMEWEQ